VPLPQDVPDGRVRLIAVEARIGKVTVEEPDSPVGPAVALLGRIGARLDGKLNPRLADIERMILIMNDIPGIKATAIPHPGEGPGVVDISINARREPISGIVFADNRQSAAIGEGLVGVVAEYASWSGDGDSTRVTLANSFWDRASDLTERHLVQLDHARFLSPSGLELRGQILFSLSSPGDSLDVTDIESERTSAELGLRYPVLRTRPWSLWAEGGFEFIESQTDILGSTTIGDDSLRVVTLGGEVLQRDSTGYTLMSAGLLIGLDAFGASEGGDPNLSRNDGSGQFILAQFDATRSQRLYGPFSLLFHAGAQYSADPLLSSEEYSIGGTSFARGLDPGEFTGDSGFGVTLELHYQRDVILLNQSLQTDFYVFGDHGQVWNRAPGAPDHSAVTSVGLGLRLGLPYQSELVTELALPLSGLSETGVPIDDDVRFYLAFQKRF
jgi:hemolysin activation/secretion protein